MPEPVRTNDEPGIGFQNLGEVTMAGTVSMERFDGVLVGGGIMSATLGTLMQELMPGLRLRVYERLGGLAQESSEAMNNAGTGHAANCELNYTPVRSDGTVDIAKALAINGVFEVSLQFWSYLVEMGHVAEVRRFLNPVPHLSFVWGEADVRFLKARHARLACHPMFEGMAYSEDPGEIGTWAPLLMEGRTSGHPPLAATRVGRGTDVDFGALARAMFQYLSREASVEVCLQQEVVDLKRTAEGWLVRVKDRETGRGHEVSARFVFLGAGGGALTLLLRSGIPEAKGYGGMPVSGEWLVCTNPEVVARHGAKVYGKAALGAPPMSVPHLDTRVIEERKALLFGPYAGFTTKFLKTGSHLDWPRSFRMSNAWPLVTAAWHNLDLARYLVGQVLQSHAQRMEALRHFFPGARAEDWRLDVAGQRVQIVKRDPDGGGKLEFGTEVVTSADGSLAALLGASPGASTAASTMIQLLHRCFPEAASREDWNVRLRRMVPSYGQDLTQAVDVLRRVRDRCNAILGLSTS